MTHDFVVHAENGYSPLTTIYHDTDIVCQSSQCYVVLVLVLVLVLEKIERLNHIPTTTGSPICQRG